MRTEIGWQYCKNPNEINEAIRTQDPNWAGLYSADQIISIIWVSDQRCYQVFWREIPDDDSWMYDEADIPVEQSDSTRE